MIKQFNIFMTTRRGIMFVVHRVSIEITSYYNILDSKATSNEYDDNYCYNYYYSRWLWKIMWHFKLPQATTVLHRKIDRQYP